MVPAQAGTDLRLGVDLDLQRAMVMAFGEQTGSVTYVDFITPGVVIMTVASGIAYAAVRLSTDLQRGIISRFRTMPVTPSSVLGGQALSSTLSNLFSCVLVVAVAFLVGFRPGADVAAWLAFGGLLVLFTLATTWLAMFFGLLAKTVEGAGAFSYILLLLIFISPSFVPTDSMSSWLRGFAENQPMTPIIETMRSLLTEGVPGTDIWIALAWSVGILVVSYTLALRVYRRSEPVTVPPSAGHGGGERCGDGWRRLHARSGGGEESDSQECRRTDQIATFARYQEGVRHR